MAEFKQTNDGVDYLIVRPDDYRPYGIDWSSQFDEDPVVSAVWTIPTGLTDGIESVEGQLTRKKIGGFVDGVDYRIECRATTQSASELTRVFYLVCRDVGEPVL